MLNNMKIMINTYRIGVRICTSTQLNDTHKLAQHNHMTASIYNKTTYEFLYIYMY